MHISIVTGSFERTLQLIIRCFNSILLTVSMLALISCAPSRPDDRWDPLQPDSPAVGAASSGGMVRSGDHLSPAMADLIGRADQAIQPAGRFQQAAGCIHRQESQTLRDGVDVSGPRKF